VSGISHKYFVIGKKNMKICRDRDFANNHVRARLQKKIAGARKITNARLVRQDFATGLLSAVATEIREFFSSLFSQTICTFRLCRSGG